MSIKRLQVSNFRSFRNLDIELGSFNVVIGANASGKSNFIEIFKFMRDITNHGLRNAISMQGGVEYLANVSIRSSKPLSLEFTCDYETKGVFGRQIRDMKVGVCPISLTYKFVIKFRFFKIFITRIQV